MSELGPSITVLAGAGVGVRRDAAWAGGTGAPQSARAAISVARNPPRIQPSVPARRDEVVVGLTPLEQQTFPKVALVGPL